MPRLTARLLSLLGALLLLGCSTPSNASNQSNSSNPSNPVQRPSCLPPGYRPRAVGEGASSEDLPERGQELDVLVAVVEGEVITKRRLAREAGGLAPGQDPASLDRQIHALLLQRARLLLFVKEAQRAGVVVRDSMLDNVVKEELESRAKSAAEAIGEPVTVAEYLEDKGLTLDEFRESVREQLQYKAYALRLTEGLGGPTRSQVDMTVSPSEVRRIYWSHPGAFDEKPAVRFAFYQLPVERYLVGDVGFLDAEEKAQAEAEKLAQAFQSGTPVAEIARRWELDEGQWKAAGEDEWADEGGRVRLLGAEANAWLFDPTRKAGDTTILNDANGPVVFGMLASKPGRRIPYDEAYPRVVQLIQFVRQRRLIETKLIEILSSRNAVQPPELAAEMLAEARKVIADIDEDPIFAAARFR